MLNPSGGNTVNGHKSSPPEGVPCIKPMDTFWLLSIHAEGAHLVEGFISQSVVYWLESFATVPGSSPAWPCCCILLTPPNPLIPAVLSNCAQDIKKLPITLLCGWLYCNEGYSIQGFFLRISHEYPWRGALFYFWCVGVYILQVSRKRLFPPAFFFFFKNKKGKKSYVSLRQWIFTLYGGKNWLG